MIISNSLSFTILICFQNTFLIFCRFVMAQYKFIKNWIQAINSNNFYEKVNNRNVSIILKRYIILLYINNIIMNNIIYYK